MTHTYNITGMTCTSCVAKVKSALLKLGDVSSAEIQLQAPQATVNMIKHIPLPKLQEALSQAGNYTITETGMALANNESVDDEATNSYYPIFLIFGYITGVSVLIQSLSEGWNWMMWMQHFMAGFFLLFSFFKLLDIKGFAEGYGSYDIVAKRLKGYGYAYPFVELALGISFLIGFQPLITNIVALIIMSISIVGVVQSLIKKSPFQCACLGTIIKLPLSKVTLFEDLLMIGMSGCSIAIMFLA
jgi:copper chaperone CopZ/uncharacterized membrane protein YphA (DoxX/SURF4 family)